MTTGPLSGRTILLVEDEYFQALDTKSWLEEAGATVIGPVGNRERFAEQVSSNQFDSAIVDINLGFGAEFAVADELARREVPMVFLTGYDCTLIPDAHAKIPCLTKPANVPELIDNGSPRRMKS